MHRGMLVFHGADFSDDDTITAGHMERADFLKLYKQVHSIYASCESTCVTA